MLPECDKDIQSRIGIVVQLILVIDLFIMLCCACILPCSFVSPKQGRKKKKRNCIENIGCVIFFGDVEDQIAWHNTQQKEDDNYIGMTRKKKAG